MSWSGLSKFFIGVVLAIAILFFAGASVARYLMTRLAAPPPRPVFPNDSPSPTPVAAQSSASPQASVSPSETVSPSDAASPEATPAEPSPSPSLAAGTYKARVTQPIGLILRQEPSRDSNELGGVEYNEEVTVLETSSDGEWLRVRLGDSGIEGWVKAGNTAQIN
jgi:Bacterial SH3 domain